MGNITVIRPKSNPPRVPLTIGVAFKGAIIRLNVFVKIINNNATGTARIPKTIPTPKSHILRSYAGGVKIPSKGDTDIPLSAVSYTHLRAHETDSYLVCR